MMYYFRYVLITFWFIFSGVLFFPVALIRKVFFWSDYNIWRDFLKFCGWGMLKLSRVRVEVTGKEFLKTQPAIFVANHQSGMDVATFSKVYSDRMVTVGKKELLYIPIWGWIFALSGNVILDRANRTGSVARLSRVAEAIKRRRISVGFFPEGTRNRTGKGMLPFKKGAFYLAIEAQIPIVPIVSSSLNDIASIQKKKVAGGTVRIEVLPPVETKGMTAENVNDLIETVRGQMLDKFREFSPEAV